MCLIITLDVRNPKKARNSPFLGESRVSGSWAKNKTPGKRIHLIWPLARERLYTRDELVACCAKFVATLTLKSAVLTFGRVCPLILSIYSIISHRVYSRGGAVVPHRDDECWHVSPSLRIASPICGRFLPGNSTVFCLVYTRTFTPSRRSRECQRSA